METCDNLYNDDFAEDGNGNRIHKTAIVNNNVTLGRGNYIGAYTVIGSNGEIRGVKQDQFKGRIEIGNNNIISELVTIQTPYEEGAVTRIGDNNLITAHTHIGHDGQVGNDNEICISIIGGYAKIGNGVMVKMGSVIRNRRIIGNNSVIGMGSIVVKDVPESITVCGNPAKIMRKPVMITISSDMVSLFCELVGDHNPIHSNEPYAKDTKFGRCIVPGTLINSLFGAMIAKQFPGAILISQDMEFKAPCFIGDELSLSMTETEIKERKSSLIIEASHNGQVLIVCKSLISKA